MGTKILILSHPDDIHAFTIIEALQAKGVKPVLWYTSDFPTLSSETVVFGRNLEMRVKGPESDLSTWDFETVWHRRPLFIPNTQILQPPDRLFAKQQCESFRHSLFEIVCPRAFWVNPPGSSRLASQKLLQQHTALEIGFDICDTLFTNDPEEVRSFIAAHPQGVIFKPLAGATWRDDETEWVPFTTQVTAEDLVRDELLRETPSIFQELVGKDHELRVTIMGRQVFAAKVLSQETKTGRLDWRKSYHELKMQPTTVPGSVLEKCFELMDRFAIVFGCFDFIVTPDGRYVFLEVNEAGQFLFIEHYTGMPLLDAFCEFLVQADKRFTWQAGRDCVRFDQVFDRAKIATDEAASRHARVVPPSYYEGNRAGKSGSRRR